MKYSFAKGLTILVMTIFALALIGGGFYLLYLGGSPNYFIAGILLAVTTFLLDPAFQQKSPRYFRICS